METKHQVHNLIVLDESGSMSSIKNSIISGFNEMVQSTKRLEQENPDQEHLISLFTFNGAGVKTIHFCEPVSKLEAIDGRKYQPSDNTPLYDAIGFAITHEQRKLQGVSDYNVLVTIMTDGEENSSREYSGHDIKKLIEELKQNRWTFTYIGTDHDVEKVAFSLSINNTLSFGKNNADIQDMFAKERYARRSHNNLQKSMCYSERCEDNYFDESRSLYRFAKVYQQYFPIALQEIRNGRKQTHWMWFIFPQIAGLGHSSTSKLYAIADLKEAYEFLQEPFGRNLVYISEELLKLSETDAVKIFGHIDALKLRSSMTLFSQVPNTNPVFQSVLDKFFGSQPDQLTLEILFRGDSCHRQGGG
ncbi:MAG: DUF1810 family protein [Tannerella sp.]|nr:DUF1810 family protein [Tannerella sp.]